MLQNFKTGDNNNYKNVKVSLHTAKSGHCLMYSIHILKNSQVRMHSLERRVRNKHDDGDDNDDDDNLIYASNEEVLLPWKYHSNYANY